MAKPLTQSPSGGGGGAGGGGEGNGGGGGSKVGGTTFVQADSTCFRDLVQRLTGPSGPAVTSKTSSHAVPKQTQKLHERRKYTKPKIEITKAVGTPKSIPSPHSILCAAVSPRGAFGPGMWAYPASPSSMVLLSPPPSSPISTPMAVGGMNSKRASTSAMELINPREEEKAIKEKRFYLHPSPRSKPRLATEPELLTLFPLTSPTSNKT